MTSKKAITKASSDSDKWLKARQKKHIKMVENSIKTLQANILNSLDILEKNPLGKIQGAKVNLSNAQKIHAKINQFFEKDWNKGTAKIISDFKNNKALVKSSFATIGESAKFTDLDETMLKVLRDGDYQKYLSLGKTHQDKVTQQVYNSVLAGGTQAELATSIRGALMGSAAVSAVGTPLANYARLYARDMIMNYHNETILAKGEQLGFKLYQYIGTLMASSRMFCRQRVMNSYTKEQINSWTFKWKGKAGDAWHFRGGYNCRHHWQPVKQEWLNEEEKYGVGKVNTFDKTGKVITPYQRREAEKKALATKAREKVKTAPPKAKPAPKGWVPEMSEHQADIWGKDSKLKGDYWHGTSGKAEPLIKSSGFKLETKTAGGKAYGDAIYLTGEKKVAARFAGPLKDGTVFKTRVNVKNPLIIKDDDHWGRVWDKALKEGTDFGKDDISKYLKKLGYDALDVRKYERFGGVVVFDPKNITVVGKKSSKLPSPKLAKVDKKSAIERADARMAKAEATAKAAYDARIKKEAAEKVAREAEKVALADKARKKAEKAAAAARMEAFRLEEIAEEKAVDAALKKLNDSSKKALMAEEAALIPKAPAVKLSNIQKRAIAVAKDGELTEASINMIIRKSDSKRGMTLTSKDVKALSKNLNKSVPMHMNASISSKNDMYKALYKDGEFKNQFQLGEFGSSGGHHAPTKGSSRDNWEKKISGGVLQENSKYKKLKRGSYMDQAGVGSERPIYGYASDPMQDGGARIEGRYGSVTFVMKDSVKPRGTVFMGNTSGFMEGSRDVMQSLKNNNRLLMNIIENTKISDGALRKMIKGDQAVMGFTRRSYTESQTYGGLNIKRDVNEILVNRHISHIEDLAKKWGVKYRVAPRGSLAVKNVMTSSPPPSIPGGW